MTNTTMTIEQLWQEMEAEGETNIAWLTRFARPQTGPLLLIALEQVARSRALFVPVSQAALPPRREWPACRGLELIAVTLDSQLHLGILLRDATYADVFTALAEDVATRVAAVNDHRQAAAELLGRLRRWQQFLTAKRNELSVEAQRGLYGELYVLRTHLLPVLGASVSVAGWKASEASHQDFQFFSGAVEVKTTAAKQPQSVRITSERQLDDTGVGALFLHVVVVDEREVPAGGSALGQSLPSIIADTRSDLSANQVNLTAFNDRLLDRGWLDTCSIRYEGRRWAVRSEHTYQVCREFPRLVEANLPTGVGDVNFAVSLSACDPFAVSVATMLIALP